MLGKTVLSHATASSNSYIFNGMTVESDYLIVLLWKTLRSDDPCYAALDGGRKEGRVSQPGRRGNFAGQVGENIRQQCDVTLVGRSVGRCGEILGFQEATADGKKVMACPRILEHRSQFSDCCWADLGPRQPANQLYNNQKIVFGAPKSGDRWWRHLGERERENELICMSMVARYAGSHLAAVLEERKVGLARAISTHP